jgi:mercuric ion transport protein
MSPSSDHTGFHRFLPSGLTGLAGLACAACCAIPLLLAAGVLGGAGWVVAGRWMPGMAILLVVLAAAAWWQAGRRRPTGGCADGSTRSRRQTR